MLVGSYPFEDPEDPRNFRKTISVSISLPLVPVITTCFGCLFGESESNSNVSPVAVLGREFLACNTPSRIM
jgi:hypothetical protein